MVTIREQAKALSPEIQCYINTIGYGQAMLSVSQILRESALECLAANETMAAAVLTTLAEEILNSAQEASNHATEHGNEETVNPNAVVPDDIGDLDQG